MRYGRLRPTWSVRAPSHGPSRITATTAAKVATEMCQSLPPDSSITHGAK